MKDCGWVKMFKGDHGPNRFLALLVMAIAMFWAGTAVSQSWSGLVASSRAINWANSGIQGGIPSAGWTQCGATIAAYGSAGTPLSPATIQSAINACGTNQYVLLGVGNFYLSGSFYVKGQSNVEIRGMGANSTFIYFYGNTGVGGDNCGGLYALVCFESSDTNYTGSISNGPVNWTAGYSQGTTVITLSTVPNLKIGNPIIVDQQDTASDIGAVLEQQSTAGGNPFTTPGNAGPYSTQGGVILPGRNQVHVYTVTGCNGSTTVGASCSGTNVAVTIDPPLEEQNWASGLSPQAWWATSPDINVGVQNLSIDGTNSGCTLGNGYGIAFFNTDNVWQRGTRDVNECRTHTAIQYTTRATIRDSYMFLARYSTSTSYGFECFAASDSLIENNIIQAIAGGIIYNEGCSGLVAGYNFEINGFYQNAGFVIPMANIHAVNDDFNLFEGNIGSQIDADIIHGSHNLNTMFRNRMAGQNPVCWASGPTNNDYASYLASTWGSCSGNTIAIAIYSQNRINNVIGNIVGTSGITTSYKLLNAVTDAGGYVFNIGVGDNHTGVAVPSDSTVAQTLFLWGNCDNTNGGAGGTAFTVCQFNNADVPVTGGLATSQQPWAQTIPGSHVLPASFYYLSKPSWWPAAKAWPIIGPDVTGGNISGVNGLAYTNPAADCYFGLTGATTDGTGGPFPFDANACYSGGGTPTTPGSGKTMMVGNMQPRGRMIGQ